MGVLRLRLLVVLLVTAVIAGSGWTGVLPAPPSVAAGGDPAKGPAPAAAQTPMTLDERREQVRSWEAGQTAPPAEAEPGEPDEPDGIAAADTPVRPTAGGAWAITRWGTLTATSSYPNLLDTWRGTAVAGTTVQFNIEAANQDHADRADPPNYHPVRVRWEALPCYDEDLAIEHDFDQVVTVPDGMSISNGKAEHVTVSAQFEIPEASCFGGLSSNVTVRVWLYMEGDGGGSYDPAPHLGGLLHFDLVPDQEAVCDPGCDSTGGVEQPVGGQGFGVNTATGAYRWQVLDAADAELQLGRSYGSDRFDAGPQRASEVSARDAGDGSGPLGPGWSMPWETHLEFADDGAVVLHEESGGRVTYTAGSGGSLTPPLGARSQLTATDSGHQLVTPDLRRLDYDAEGRLTAITLRGDRTTTVTYADAGSELPATVTDRFGRVLSFDYDGGRLTEATLDDGRSVRYGYTGDLLTSVTDLGGATTTYGYDSGSRLTTITGPDGHALLQQSYDSAGRVAEQTAADGAVTSFVYEEEDEDDTDVRYTHVTTPDGGVRTDVHMAGLLVARIDPFGNATAFQYDDKRTLVREIDAQLRHTVYRYDNRGRLVERDTEAGGPSWRYDTAGLVTSFEDGAGRQTTLEYTSEGMLSATEDQLGNRTLHTYTDDGQVETVTTPEGRTTTYEYDGRGNRTAVIAPDGAREERTYDAGGRLLSVTDPRGHAAGDPEAFTTTYSWDDANQLISRNVPDSGTETFSYDDYGSPLEVTDAAGRVTAYSYDVPGRIAERTDPGGRVTGFTYDATGRLAAVLSPDGGTTSYTYDAAGRRIGETSARGSASGADPADHTWAFGYDSASQPVTVTDPLGHTTAYTFDHDGRILSVTDPTGAVRTVTYDGSGLLRGAVDGDNRRQDLFYDNAGNLIRFNDRRNQNWNLTWDGDGNQTSLVTPSGARTTYGYDENGRLGTVTDPRGNAEDADPAEFTWTHGYDDAGLPASITDPLGHTQSITHDARGLPTSRTDALGHSTATSYDALGRITRVTGPDGGTTDYAYDTAGNLVSRTDANGHVSEYGYDPAGRPVSVTDPLERTRTLAYDLEGNLVEETNARGQTTEYTLDPLGRVTRAEYSDATPTAEFGYDAAGRPTEISDGTGVRTFGNRDGEGRPRTVTLPDGRGDIRYTYDADGNITSVSTPEGETTAYAFDSDGRMSSQNIAFGHQTTYEYNLAGHLATVTSPTGNGHTETRDYDAAGRLSEVTTGSAAGELSAWTLTRDAGGQPLQVDAVRSGDATRQLFEYDPNGRLIEECTAASGATECPTGDATTGYTYDQVGNRLTATTGTTATAYEYDAADQLLEAVTGTATTAFSHDADGNMTSDGAGTFIWNAAGRLASATTSEGDHTYTYDAEGNRVTTALDGDLRTSTVWDTLQPRSRALAEYDGSGDPTAGYTYGPGGQVQTQSHATEGYQQYHLDWLGSVADTTDSTGAPQHRYSYDAFGTATHSEPGTSAPDNPFTFTGAYTADTTDAAGLYLNARDYRPDLGRFTGTDPYPGDQGAPHNQPYSYADNMPTSRIDPSGLCSNPVSWLWTRLDGRDCSNTLGPNTGKVLDSAESAINDPHPVVRGVQWLTGLGPEHVTYGPGSQGVRDLQSDVSMDVIRHRVICDIWETGAEGGRLGYNILAEEGGTRFLTDGLAVISLGLSADRNATIIFTGSYDVDWRASYDPATGWANINFEVSNTTSFNSLTHPPVPFLRKPYEKYVGQPANDLLNRMGGPLSDVTSTYQWSERLHVGRRP